MSYDVEDEDMVPEEPTQEQIDVGFAAAEADRRAIEQEEAD